MPIGSRSRPGTSRGRAQGASPRRGAPAGAGKGGGCDRAAMARLLVRVGDRERGQVERAREGGRVAEERLLQERGDGRPARLARRRHEDAPQQHLRSVASGHGLRRRLADSEAEGCERRAASGGRRAEGAVTAGRPEAGAAPQARRTARGTGGSTHAAGASVHGGRAVREPWASAPRQCASSCSVHSRPVSISNSRWPNATTSPATLHPPPRCTSAPPPAAPPLPPPPPLPRAAAAAA